VITVPRAALPPAEEGTYYWADLIGLRVFTLTGQDLGVVTGLMETGANDVLIVQGERERLVPFVVGPYVRSVRLEAGRIEVDWDPDFS
jgi:16S rRNA processing protein RimM